MPLTLLWPRDCVRLYHGARNGEIEALALEDHANAIQVIQAFHPMHILYQQDVSTSLAKHSILENVFTRVYSSCASRKAEVLLLMEVWNIVSSADQYLTGATAGIEEIFKSFEAACAEGVNLHHDHKGRLLNECEEARTAYDETLNSSKNRIARARPAERRTVAGLLRKEGLAKIRSYH